MDCSYVFPPEFLNFVEDKARCHSFPTTARIEL